MKMNFTLYFNSIFEGIYLELEQPQRPALDFITQGKSLKIKLQDSTICSTFILLV